MLHKIRKFKTIFVLGGLVAVWLFTTWAIPATGLDASNLMPALLTFQSPIGNPVLSLNKTSDNSAPKTGEVIRYTLSYSNVNAGSQAFNVRLYDFLPAGVEVFYTNPPYDVYENGVLIFNAPSVGPGTENIEVAIHARVREGYDGLYNQALVTADGVPPTHASLLSTVYPPVRELTLSKTGYDVVLKNNEIVYQVRCENTGDIGLHNVVLLDVLPAAVTFKSATPAPDSVSDPLIQWNVGELPSGHVWTTTLRINSPAGVGLITNTAIATTEYLTPVHALFTTRVISEGAILQVTKTGSAPEVLVGDELVYTLAYENIGNVTATTTLLTDTYPADITVTATAPTPDSSTSTRDVWQLGDLAPGASGRIVITTTIGGVPTRILHNVADINAPGSDVFGDQATLDITVAYHQIYLPVVMRRY